MSILTVVQQVAQMDTVDVHEDELSDGLDTLWSG
jgi:hypothetical protein